MDMTLAKYFAAINALAVKAGAIDPGQEYCDAEAWREMYEDGLTPEEAWAEETAAAAEIAG